MDGSSSSYSITVSATLEAGAREDGSSAGWGREMDMGTIKYIVKVVSSTL